MTGDPAPEAGEPASTAAPAPRRGLNRLRMLRASFRVLGVVRANRDLRLVQVAFLGFNTAEDATWIAILVYAYERGGPTATGVAAVVQLVPAALLAPLLSSAGDRYRRDVMLVVGFVAQSASMALTGVALVAGAPLPGVLALAALTAVSVTTTRPVQAALVPALARTPDELTAANVAGGWTESLGLLIGPVATAVLLGVSGPAAVMATMALVVSGSALLAARIRPIAPPPPAAVPDSADRAAGGARSAVAGFGELARRRRPRAVVALLGLEWTVLGALDVLYVVLAFEVLGSGSSGAGVLNAAFGAGGFAGILVTALLVGRQRLVIPLVTGAAVWGAVIVGAGVVPVPAVAIALVGVGGAARSLMDVAGRTLLQRLVPDTVRARVFGVVEGGAMAGLAVGSMLAPALVALVGTRGAMLVTGGVLPATCALAWRGLGEAEDVGPPPSRELELLCSLPAFAALPAPVVEHLASRLERLRIPAGAVILRQGEPGNLFYVVLDGDVSVVREGAEVARTGAGGYFGEIALLRDVPRTASVVAVTDVELRTMAREDFLAAVTGNARSVELMDAVVEQRSRRPDA